MIHTGPIQGPFLPLNRFLPNDTPAEKQRQNVKTALVSGSAAGLPLRCSWMPPVYREIGRVEPPCEPRRASGGPCPGLPDVAADLPRPDALAVHAPLIAWRSAPNFALRCRFKEGHPRGLRLRVLYIFIL